MRPILEELTTAATPEALAAELSGRPGLVLLRSALFESPQARYSLVGVDPFLTFRSYGSRCELHSSSGESVQFGNPWHILDGLMSRYELLEELDLPFPLGGCVGYWGYDLKNFVEPRLPRKACNDLELPDCHVGFYDSLALFDHRLGKAWIVSTGVQVDGSRSEERARERARQWIEAAGFASARVEKSGPRQLGHGELTSNFTRDQFIAAVERAQRYIRSGDIYQINLSHRLSAARKGSSWDFFRRLLDLSPAPFAAYLDCGGFELASSSPEQFLRMSGSHVVTRPIKGTRPRGGDPTRDAQLAYELQTSPKENAELVMITDLLRNDLGRICEYGTVQTPELARLERYPQVQHLVSTVEGRLREGMSHFTAFSSCFPGGSITGAPKIRAMEIIDELEPLARGAYTGCAGYLGFNRESQLSILIRSAVCTEREFHFQVGAGIVADSIPEQEYEETLAKAKGFLNALGAPKFEPASVGRGGNRETANDGPG